MQTRILVSYVDSEISDKFTYTHSSPLPLILMMLSQSLVIAEKKAITSLERVYSLVIYDKNCTYLNST